MIIFPTVFLLARLVLTVCQPFNSDTRSGQPKSAREVCAQAERIVGVAIPSSTHRPDDPLSAHPPPQLPRGGLLTLIGLKFGPHRPGKTFAAQNDATNQPLPTAFQANPRRLRLSNVEM